jgi:DNA-binding PadR family transcriptional regulator
MGAGKARDVPATPMHSPVNWALLGLVIERPSYAYELAQRFDRTYEGALSLSSASHVYTALSTLTGRGLIEELAGSRAGRQPRPRYGATPKGLEDYKAWLVGQLAEERRRQRLFVLQLTALTHDPEAALDTLGRYEQACLQEARSTPLDLADAVGDEVSGLATRLLSEQRRLVMGEKLQWTQYARAQLKALANARALGR